MPIGYLVTVGLMAVGVLVAVRPLARSGPLGTASWLVSVAPGESPFAALAWVLAASALAFAQGDLETPVAWIGLAVVLGGFAVATPVLVRRSLAARAVLDEAFARELGAGWRDRLDPALRHRDRLPWGRILFFPFPFFRGPVRRFRDISYGDAGRHNRLDLYRRAGVQDAPILIHLHGGHFRRGRKSFESRPLLHRLARRGWICISANYRLQPGARFPDYVVDLKQVIRWVREHAHEHGGDPERVIVAGSSAGAHIAVTAAFTGGDPSFQPGFEEADTSVSAAVGLYGYYGPVDTARQPLPSSPADYVHPNAPPVLIAHGSQDTYVPPEHARSFAAQARAVSDNPVIYAELPGAQHSFDLFHSIRFELLIDAIEDLAAWVFRPIPQTPPRRRRSTTGLSRSAVVQPPTV